MSWIDNCNYETGFEIEQAVNDSNFIKIADVDSNITTYVLIGAFNLEDTYNFRVRAKSKDGYSGYSNIATATVLLNVPVDLNIQFISDTAAVFSWTDNNDFETGYVIGKYISGWGILIIKEMPANTTETVIEDTFVSGRYYNYLLYAKMGYFTSEPVYFPHTNFEFPPPYDLSIEGINNNSLELTWKEENNYELGFVIERSNDGNNFVEIARASANIHSYTDINLDTSLTYIYRLFAYSRHNQSEYSSEIEALFVPQLNPLNKFQIVSPISWMTVSYDASIVAFGGYTTTNNVAVYIYDTFSGRHLQTLNSVDSLDRIFEEVTISPDNQLVAATGENSITIWDINTGAAIKNINNFLTPNVMKFSYDGNHLIVEYGGQLRFYNIQTWQYETRIITPDYIFLMDINLDQTIIATADGQTNIKLWDYNTGSFLREIPSSFNARPIKFNKAGLKLYAVIDYELMIWDVGTASIVLTIPDFWGRIDFAINESRDIVAGSMINQGMGLWKISSGKYIQRFFSNDEGYQDLFYTPNGTELIARASNRHYRIWDIIKKWCSPYE